MSVPAAGKHYFNLGRNASYAAAARGQIPTITIGGRIFAVVAALERMLAKAGENVRQVQFLCHNSTSSRMATTSRPRSCARCCAYPQVHRGRR